MGFGKSRGKGGVYEYFFCLGRHTGRTSCDLPYIGVEKVEAAVLREWHAKGWLSTDEIAQTRMAAIEAIDEYLESSKLLLAQQGKRLEQLERKKQKLIDAYLDDALSAEDVKERQLEVQREIADAKNLLRSAEDDRLLMLERLDTVLSALEHAARLYEAGSDDTKRSLNQAIFKPFEVDLIDDAGTPLAEAAHEASCRVEAALSAPVAAVVRYAGATREQRAAGADIGEQGAHAETPSKLMLTGGSNVTHLAATVREGWNDSARAQSAC